jgi:Flp pilus assembly protein TadD
MSAATGTFPICLLDQARDAIRRSALGEAEQALRQASPAAGEDPGYLNLVGILHECRGRKRQARKSYGRAIAQSSNYRPAQQNLRRLYELAIFGRTSLTAALGDERRPRAPRTILIPSNC